MKKILICLIVLFVMFSFSSCKSSEIAEDSTLLEEAANEIAEKHDMPDWAINEPWDEDNVYIYGVGSGKMATFKNSRKFALIEARAELANKALIFVQTAGQIYSEEGGESTYDIINDQALQALKEASIQTADAWISGYKQVDMYEAKDGTVYVLLAVKADNVFDSLDETVGDEGVKEFKENKAATLAHMRADKFVKDNIKNK